jgi:hypothetical protein
MSRHLINPGYLLRTMIPMAERLYDDDIEELRKEGLIA